MQTLTNRNQRHEENLDATANDRCKEPRVSWRSKYITMDQFPASLLKCIFNAVIGIVSSNVPSQRSYHDHR